VDAFQDDPKPWDTLGSTHLSRKPWLTLRQDRVRLPNGAVIEEYNVLEYPDWINVIAVTRGGRVILVRQYRHGLGAVHYELPAGVCDPDDTTPEETARRELLEETGHGGGVWAPLTTLSANPGTHANLVHSFLATDVELIAKPRPEETEDIRLHLVDLKELRAILAGGGVVQALHAAPLWRYLYGLAAGG